MRTGLAALAAVAACLAAAAPATASPADWADVSRQVAAPWPDLQAANGHFSDYVLARAPGAARDDYGDAMLGYALLQVGIRESDGRATQAGLRALTRVANAQDVSPAVAMFTYTGLAAGYNLARTHLASDSFFAANRGSWEARLKRVKVLRLGPRKPVTNKSLVESVEILELARTGLKSTQPGTILRDPGAAVALVKRLLGRDLPAAAKRWERGGRALIGDFPDLPLPYHSLALGFLARSVDLLGAQAPSKARSLLQRAAAASLALAAPDGDVGYEGRSQEQSWTNALTAYGAEVAGRLAPSRAPALRGLAERAIPRIPALYGVGPEGLFVTPALRVDLDAGIKGLDEYVAAVPYNGLTLAGLNWAIEAAAGRALPPGSIGSDRNGSAIVGRGSASVATVRAGDLWFAVKQGPDSGRDMRADFGLIALKALTPGGAWVDVLRAAPRRKRDSAGPLRGSGSSAAFPVGTGLKASGGAVTVDADFRTSAGKVVRRKVRFRFEVAGCGVRMTVPLDGARYELSAFFPAAPEVQPTSAMDAQRSFSLNRPAKTSIQSGFASAVDPRLVRACMIPAAGRGALTLSVCAR